MSPVLKSKSKDMSSAKTVKEQQKSSTKPSPSRSNGGNVLSSAYNPASGTFHSLESAPSGALPASQSNIWFPQIHEVDDQSRSSLDTAADCDSVSNNGSGSGESDDPKDKVTGSTTVVARPGTPIPGCDVDKRDKIRQKNEKKHQRQREKRAQELHERCSSFLMTRKLETLSQKLVPMGFPGTQATHALILNEGRIEDSVSWLLFEGKHVDTAIVDDNRPLKIDISEELATISYLEVKYKCSKQEVERLVISNEGDLEKTLLDLRAQKLEPNVGAASQKVEDSSGRVLANEINKVTSSPQNTVTRLQPTKSALAINIQLPQPREDRDINRLKMVTEDGSRNPQTLRGIQPRVEWTRPQTSTPPMEHRWATSSPSPSVSQTTLAVQHAMLSAKSDASRFTFTNNDINHSLKPVIMMQRPQSMTKQNLVSTAGAAGISTSPPGNAGRFTGVSNMEMRSLEQKIGRMALNSQNRDFHPSNPSFLQPINHIQSSVANLTDNSAAAAITADTLWGNNSTRWGSLRPPKNPNRLHQSLPGWPSANGTNVQMLDYTSIDWSHGSTPQFRHNSMANLKMDRLHETWSTSFMGRCNGLEENGAILLNNSSSVSMTSQEWTSPFAGNDLFGVSRQSVASSPTPQERGLN
ncbi:hypothetical protein ZOSMA_6G00380 [Zostera marina]|uniref:UBA domain-containing protein n=1 Tax=Zostera marina TaxID=29655 RepID=A0A0K9NQS9_ZOSMR|nr:hypothetical protein ZOSMA_6G00380 [Zostera marina]